MLRESAQCLFYLFDELWDIPEAVEYLFGRL